MYGNMPYGWDSSSDQILAAASAYVACVAVFVLLVVVFQVWVFWRILTKAGFSGWLALLNLIGGLGTFALLLILAFGEWPSVHSANVTSGYPPPTQYPAAPPPPPPA